ncbi:MAG TPA: ABC transporter ATP-binding protein [Candidatus Paceibacterota bacterium]
MQRVRHLWGLYQKAFGAYTWQIVLIMVLAFVSSIVEGIGISAIIPIFSFVGGTPGAAGDTISHIIAGMFSFFHITYTFRMLLIFIGVLFVLRIFFIFGIQYVTGYIIYNYERDLRLRLFGGTLESRWSYLSQQKVGNLEQLLTTNTSNASQFFGNISASALICTKVLIYIVIAINISWWIALFSLLAGFLMVFVLRPIFYRDRAIATDAERTNRSLAHFVSEHVIGMKAIKAMALEEPVKARGREFFDLTRTLNLRARVMGGYVQVLVQSAGIVFVAITFAIMYRSPGFTLASFAVIVYAINQIFAQIQSGQNQLHTIVRLLPYIGEAFAYGDRTKANAEARGGGAPFALQQSIEFRHVSFTYPERGSVLSDADFQIHKGELLGIVGPSGAGKSTLADLLLRLIEPTSGMIVVDGRDVQEISVEAWRSHVGYVAQDAVLLNDTIEQNIRFYNAKVGMADVVAAAKLANIHEFIETLPRGYETVIGDRGILLSGGQRQRVALARVLARKPELLVLDEATSSLDQESERAIQAAVEGLRGGITIVVIAHRLSTIEGADRFIGIKDGVVSELSRDEVFATRSV